MANQPSKAKTGANAVGFVAAVLFALLAANLIGNRFFKRLDFTQDRIYTLSQSSRDLVKKLPDRLTIKAFISGDLQPPFTQYAQYTRDLLDEYAQASKGKIKWEAIDPGTDAKLKEEATKFKVQKIQRGQMSSDKLEISSNYLGVAFQYQGNIESIPEINSIEGLEFQMTGIIKRMTVKRQKIAFANTEGELTAGGQDQQGGHGGLQFMSRFMNDYDVQQVGLKEGKLIGDDVDALVIVGPKQAMSERGKFIVDQFLMKGKAVAFFVDGMIVEQPKQQMQMPGMPEQPRIGRKNEHGLDDLLEHYGFKVRDDLILEPRQNAPGPVPVGGQMLAANYPTFVAATKIDDKHPVMDHIKLVILPFASSVERIKDKQPGFEVAQLITSTADAWRQTGFFLFDPANQRDMKIGEDKGPFALAFGGKGKLTSFFAGKPYPNEKGEKVQAPDPNVSAPPDAEKLLNESTGTPRIIVVGNSAFASDEYTGMMARYIQLYMSNAQFFMSVMDYLAGDQTLSSIRAKGVQSRPITVSSNATPTVVKFANVIGVPLAFIVYGIVRWRVRSARRKNIKL